MRGDGSVYEERDPRAGGTRWVAQLVVEGRKAPVKRRLSEVPDGKGGKRRAKKADAEKLLKEMRRLAARGELLAKAKAPEPLKVPTVAEALREWIAWLPDSAAAPGARTVANYRSLISNDLAPSDLGAMRLDAVNDSHVTALFAELAAKGRAGGTITKERSILGRAFRRAKKVPKWREGLAAWSTPMPDIGPEDMPKTKPVVVRRKMTPDEIRALLAATAEHRFLGTWVRLGVDSCARPNELAALRWCDLDLTADKPTVSITRGIAWESVNGRRVPVLTTTKTGEAGHHTVTISPSTVAALRAHWKHQADERQAAPGAWPDEQAGIDLTDLVFHKPDGRLVDDNHQAYELSKASKAAELEPVTPYLTRHAGAELIRRHFGVAGPLVADAALGHKPQGVSPALANYVTFGGVVDSTCLDAVLYPPAEGEGDAQAVAQ